SRDEDDMSALIIPCFVTTQWDVRCLHRLLDSVQAQSRTFDRVYLIDDASPHPYEVPHAFVERIGLAANGGPARARNVGVARALRCGIEKVLFTDHDCILDREWNDQMTSFLDEGEFAAVGGMTYSWGRTLLDRYHDLNGTLAGKWLLPDRKELWY